jgi:hypothetical protein
MPGLENQVKVILDGDFRDSISFSGGFQFPRMIRVAPEHRTGYEKFSLRPALCEVSLQRRKFFLEFLPSVQMDGSHGGHPSRPRNGSLPTPAPGRTISMPTRPDWNP